MVSIHNTHEYHNYISSIPIHTVTSTNPNTILGYIQSNYPEIYNTIIDLKYISNKLNNPSYKYTLFLPLSDFDYTNLSNNLYKGKMMIDDKEYIIVSEGGTQMNIKQNNINGMDINQMNIEVDNGIIHII